MNGRSLDLVAQTRLEMPLMRVRSTSWIVADGPAKARTMVLEPDGAWVELPDGRRPLPVQMAIHERQQYGLYAYLLLAQQRGRVAPGPLTLSALPFPPITLTVGADGLPVAADYRVDAPEDDKPPIDEHAIFAGRIVDRGVMWFRHMILTQDGKPYFALDIERFAVERG